MDFCSHLVLDSGRVVFDLLKYLLSVWLLAFRAYRERPRGHISAALSLHQAFVVDGVRWKRFVQGHTQLSHDQPTMILVCEHGNLGTSEEFKTPDL